MDQIDTPLQGGGATPLSSTELACLLAALTEVQNTIRAYDTKAQIMGVGFIFSVTMIGSLLAPLENSRTFDVFYLVIGFVMLVGPVVLFGSVLYPSRGTTPSHINALLPIRGCLYVTATMARDYPTLMSSVESADWRSELVYELGRLSMLRETKRVRFLRAMYAAGLSFALILGFNLLKTAQLM